MLPPQTISGNNRRAGLTYLFIVDFVLVGLIVIGYLLSRDENFMEIWRHDSTFRLAMIIGFSLSFSIHFITNIWRAVIAFQNKTMIFNQQKVQFTINDNLQWEAAYSQITQLNVKRDSRSTSPQIISLNFTVSSDNHQINHQINSSQLDQENLNAIVKACQGRQIRIT